LTHEHLGGLDGVWVELDDESLWARQREEQRSSEGLVLKVAGRARDLERVLSAASTASASMVARATLGVSWLRLPPSADPAGAVEALRRELEPLHCTVLDGATDIPSPWPSLAAGVISLMERVKARFDPAGSFRPHTYIGGI
jgi:glycolate oxidase FAD binding subunit